MWLRYRQKSCATTDGKRAALAVFENYAIDVWSHGVGSLTSEGPRANKTPAFTGVLSLCSVAIYHLVLDRRDSSPMNDSNPNCLGYQSSSDLLSHSAMGPAEKLKQRRRFNWFRSLSLGQRFRAALKPGTCVAFMLPFHKFVCFHSSHSHDCSYIGAYVSPLFALDACNQMSSRRQIHTRRSSSRTGTSLVTDNQNAAISILQLDTTAVHTHTDIAPSKNNMICALSVFANICLCEQMSFMQYRGALQIPCSDHDQARHRCGYMWQLCNSIHAQINTYSTAASHAQSRYI